MRLRSHTFMMGAGLIVAGVMALRSSLGLPEWLDHHQVEVRGIEAALPSEVYVLETNRWLTFEIRQPAPLIRLISNASLPQTQPVQPGSDWPYAVEYRFLDALGQQIATGVYHFKAKELQFTDRNSGELVEVNAYLDDRLRPLGGRRCILNLLNPAFNGAQRLELRLHHHHETLREVAVRVYLQSKVAERKMDYMWNRLSDDQQRDLARGNVYSKDGLTEREKRGLLTYRWAVAAPEGIPGTDFISRTIFIREDSEHLQAVNPWVPGGIVADAHHRAVLPLTNTTGLIRLEFAQRTPMPSTQVISNTLRWHRVGRPTETNRLTWSNAFHQLWSPGQSSLLEISSSHPIAVRAFHVEAGRTNEITPPAAHVPTFSISPTNSIDYVVDHADNEPSLFRVDLRHAPTLSNEHALESRSVRCTFLDEQGDVLQIRDIPLTNELSTFDWWVSTNGLTNISTPQSLCFALPSTVHRLRVTPQQHTLLVNAYARPSRFVRQLQLPEDLSPARALTPSQPSWFTVRPPDHLLRRSSGESHLVRIQPRPPEIDPLVQSGEYEWESFLPTGDVRGQMLLIPPSQARAMRPGSSSFSYFPVEVNTSQTVQLKGDAWEQVVTPNLMLLSSNGTPGRVRITLDDQPLLDSLLETPVTRVSLGAVAVGEHRLHIHSTQPLSACLNHIIADTHAMYLQRFCVETTSNTLHFPYLKQDPNEETLALRLFSPVQPQPEPFRVRIELVSSVQRRFGPFQRLTLLQREARITPGQVSQARLVAGSPAELDEGQPVFLTIGPDMPPGPYTLAVTVTAPSPRWLSLSRTTPGLAERIEFASQRHVP